MANNFFRRRARKPRQEWNPHWTIKLLYTLLSSALSLLKIAVGAAATVLMIVVICGIVFVGTLGDYLQEDILTEAGNWSIDDYDVEETSFMYYVDSHGDVQQLQQIYTTTDRQWVRLEDIPQDLINATVAIEDKRFYEHQGVDWITTVKACLNMFFGGDSQFGGSTITQQLVKNVTDAKSITVQRKVMEIFRAQVFEKEYDKDLIMEQYLNRIYLGRGCYGVKSAAAEYFGKELQSLTTAECASLISITNNPSLFNPYSENEFKYEGEMTNGADRNRSRQLKVLYQMYDQGYLTREAYDEARNQEMVFKEGIEEGDRWVVCENCGYEGTVSTYTQEGDTHYCPNCGQATSISVDASQHIYSWFVDAVLNDVAAEFAAKDGVDWETAEKNVRDYYMGRIQKGGYHIYTTLDMDVQRVVDEVYQNLDNIPGTRSAQQLQSAIVVVDNRTGDIVALSGGVGEKKDFLAYNRATQAKLQTGSSQKPISVYAPGFEKGTITPATVVKDMPIFYNEDGSPYPKNDNRKYNYSRTVYNGIVSSVNTISSRSLMMEGYDYAYNFAKYNFGQKSLTDDYPQRNGKSLSDLGIAPLAMGALTIGSTVREMASAYATFPDNGVYREGRLFTKVYNSEGELVLDNTQDSKQIMGEKAVNYMNYTLYNAANHGTGGAAIFPGQSIAGKTGTTSSNRDRWFCGYTSHYTAAVWCGYDNPEEIHLTGSGANPAAVLWKKVMQPIHKGLDSKGLYNGNAFKTVGVCLDSGKLSTQDCLNDVRGIERVNYVNVYPEDAPTETCDKHYPVEYCVTGGGVATEYCHLFAEHEDVEIATRSLVKMTPDEVEEIKKAMNKGLLDSFYSDSYVYFVDDSGNPIAWHGFHDDINIDLDIPYMLCPVHTKEAWENYGGYDDDSGYGDEDGYGDYDDGDSFYDPHDNGYDDSYDTNWNDDDDGWG